MKINGNIEKNLAGPESLISPLIAFPFFLWREITLTGQGGLMKG